MGNQLYKELLICVNVNQLNNIFEINQAIEIKRKMFKCTNTKL